MLCTRQTETNHQCTPISSFDVWSFLGAKLEKLKAVDVDKLQKELHEEKARNHELKEKLKHKQRSSTSKLQRYRYCLHPCACLLKPRKIHKKHKTLQQIKRSFSKWPMS